MSDHNPEGKSWAIVIAAVITAIIGPIVVWYVTHQQAQSQEQIFQVTVSALQTQIVNGQSRATLPAQSSQPTSQAIYTTSTESGQPPSFYFERATAHYQNGRYYEAISEFGACIQFYPTFADCYNGLGMAYREIGDLQQALPNHNRAIEIVPRYDFYFERGVTYHQLAEYDEAIRDFEICVEKNPSFCNCYVRLGMAYRDKGDFTTALPYHNRAIEICPARADFYWERGVTYQRMGNTSLAEADFNKARELGYGR